MAEAVKTAGYSTGIFGKWHLGDAPDTFPTRHGFDYWFGVPYSNDMNSLGSLDMTEEAVQFIEDNANTPFLAYMPHLPLFATIEFDGSSLRGLYGDVVEKLDWSVGQVRAALERLGLAENTPVIFTSDNGPWQEANIELSGSAGLLRGSKSSTWEGGVREPTIFWWSGMIAPATIMTLAAPWIYMPPCWRGLTQCRGWGAHPV